MSKPAMYTFLIYVLVSTYGIAATHNLHVWWSRYAAESRPFGVQKSWTEPASQEYQQSVPSSNYKAKSSWNKQSFGSPSAYSGGDQSWSGKGSGSGGGKKSGGSWGAGGKQGSDSGFDIWSGKPSQDYGSWSDQHYQDTGSWSDNKQYQDAGSWSDSQYQDTGSWSDKQYQDTGISWAGKKNQNQAYSGKTGSSSSWSDQQNQGSGGSSWSGKKSGQGSGKGSWSGQQYEDTGSWADKGTYQGTGVNSWTTKKGQLGSGGKSWVSNQLYKQYPDAGIGYIGEDYYQYTSEPDYYDYQGGSSKSQCQCKEKFLERVQDLEKKVNEMYMGKEKLTTKVWELVNRAEKADSQSGKQRQIVSFSALSSKNLPYLSKSQIIKFDEVLVNNGGAYDPHTGTFYAPVAGVYLFSATILSGFNATIESTITLNGHEASLLYSGSYKNRGSGTNTVILNLRKGDEVAVAVYYDNGNYVHGKWSTFSGVLLETY